MSRLWTDEEREQLRAMAPTMTIAQIAEKLGRSYNSVNCEVSQRKIRVLRSDGIVYWSTEDIETAKAMAARKASVKEICAALNRTERAVYRILSMNGMGVWRAILWSAQDAEFLRANGPSMTAAEIGKGLNRTRMAVRNKAVIMGVTLLLEQQQRPPKTPRAVKQPRWTPADEELLRDASLSIAELAPRLNRTERSVERKMQALGLKIHKWSYVPQKRKPAQVKPKATRRPVVSESRLAWCGICSAPVVNTTAGWQGHYERIGCNRPARPQGFMEGLRA